MTDADGGIVHAVMEAVSVHFDLVACKAITLPHDFAARAAAVMVDSEV